MQLQRVCHDTLPWLISFSLGLERNHMKILPPLTANPAAAILGIWKLKFREDVDATEQLHIDPLLGPEPLGILCFGPGHFAA
jgi:hypothetical protein